MDKELLQKIKELSKEFSKTTRFRGSIQDDRLRPLREQCFQEGAKQLWDLLQKLHPILGQMQIVLTADASIPADAFIMVPSGGFVLPDAYIPPIEYYQPSTLTDGKPHSDAASGGFYVPAEHMHKMTSPDVDRKEIDKKALDILNTKDQAPNDERSVATDDKSKKITPASKRNTKKK